MSSVDWEQFYRDLTWDRLMDEYLFFVDFPRQQLRNPETWKMVYAEYRRRHAEGVAGR